MVDARDRVAGERGPRAGHGAPQLRCVHGADGVVEAAAAGAARDQDVAGREQGGVHLPPGERHRPRVRPRRIRLIEVDDLRRVRRRVAAAHVQDLPGRIHDRGPVATPAGEVASRAVGPTARAADVEPARRLILAGIKHAPIRRDKIPRIVLGLQVRGRERAPAAAVPDLRSRDDGPSLISAAHHEHLAVGERRRGRIPSSVRHRRRRLPRLGRGIEDVRVRQSVVISDVPPGHEQPTVREEVVASAEQPRRRRDRGEPAGQRVPQLRITVPTPAQHPAVRE